MDNMMNFSYMTRLCHSMVKTSQVQSGQAGGAGFYDKLVEKAEYKQYIYDKIASLPVHSSNMQDSVAVQISDAGFEAMRNDPAYEKWVLDTIQASFQCPDPWSGVCGGKFVVFYFGAAKEESYGESWRLGFRNGNGQKLFNEKAKESFWERRQKRRKEWLAQLEELEEKKALSKRMARSRYFMELSSIKPLFGESKEPLNCDRLAMQIFSSFKANILLQSFQGKKV
ncbi:MAG: hypothetical protein NC231_01195 [Bacillus sp. (in: Bacteria)]|nr:hypothetical protein [Bacillus sp. (in: firmicutes)]MCM1426404.1 hypothetical protein [Eubacterium sp.]